MWSLPVGWAAFSAACASSLVATGRFLFPNVLFEPPQAFKAGFPSEFNIGEVRVQATFVNHPGVCAGYRVFTSAGSVAYLPDHEPFQRMRLHAGHAHGAGRRLPGMQEFQI